MNRVTAKPEIDSPESPPIFRRRLLVWFRRNRRDLPWRHDVTPYRVWISEVMLQQTVVKTVIPFFERWIRRFPDVPAVARADERTILKAWEGLGYYSRARNIRKTARILVSEHAGRLPDDFPALRQLPGIGDYTASAIMSIAFRQPFPVADANVRRVLRRVLALRMWNRQSEHRIDQFLKNAISRRNPGAFNEALMELGQTVCLNRDPLCFSCPLRGLCEGCRQGIQNQIPERSSSKSIRKQSLLLLLIWKQQILIKRTDRGLLAGLWVLPKVPLGPRSEQQALSFIGKLASKPPTFERSLPIYTHHYTRFAEQLHPRLYRLSGATDTPPDGWRWIRLRDIHRYPFPSVYRKILADLRPS